MAAAKRVRWECPHGLHAGVLGSTRPPKDSIVRFCLDCSIESGRLVQRTAPALERKRQQNAERAVARRASKAERERAVAASKWLVEVVEVDGTTSELDVIALMAKLRRLPEVRERWAESWPGRSIGGIRVDVRRRSDGFVSGRAWPLEERMVLSIGRGVTRQRVEELAIHELMHLCCSSRVAHGGAFRASLLRAARQWWPGIATVRNTGDVYEMDERIVMAAIALARA